VEDTTAQRRYWYGTGGELVGESDGSDVNIQWIYFDGRRISKFNLAPAGPWGAYFYDDAVGSLRLETDGYGNTNCRADYCPFGEPVGSGCSGYESFQYAGLKTDPYDGGHSAANRRYNDTYYRWFSPNPGGVKVVRLDDPQTWNMYAYVTDNPTTLNDPSGLHGNCNSQLSNENSGCTAADPNNVQDSTLKDNNQHKSAPPVSSEQRRKRSSLEEIRTAWTAYLKWTSGNKNWLASNYPTINSILDNLEFVAAFSDLGSEDPEAMLGSEGAQFTSKTLWTEGDARIDAENPAPGRRPGMIHYQNGSRGSTQYIFDIKLGSFRGLTQAENEKLLSNPMVQAAIQKGLRYLGVR
jgi:RHS repeat-associated protein